MSQLRAQMTELEMAFVVLDGEVRLMHEDLQKALAGSLYREESARQWAIKAFSRANKILDAMERGHV